MLTSNNCIVCGATMLSTRNDKRTCSSTCRNKLRIITRDQDNYQLCISNQTLQASSNDIDSIKEELERLQDQNEQLKESIRKHHRRIEQLEELIEKRDDTITNQKQEIERLKLDRRVIDKTKINKTQHFAREHLERILTSEIKRQFPNDAIVQTHIEAIRSFNASYINALVTA